MLRTEAATWHYVGHFGTLGPLTFDQMEELVEGGVIERETFVWNEAMPTWMPARAVADFGSALARRGYDAEPPPFTPPVHGAPPITAAIPTATYASPMPGLGDSDKSRVVGALLNVLFPGVGRMYLGYWAIGVLQLMTACLFAGIVWSLVDAAIMLIGGVTHDGYGRVLRETRIAASRAHRTPPRDVRY